MEQVSPHHEFVKRLFDFQLGTWRLALLETFAFLCACVDVFGFVPPILSCVVAVCYWWTHW